MGCWRGIFDILFQCFCDILEVLFDFPCESEDTGDYTFADSVKAGIYDDLYVNFAEIANH